MSYRLQLELSLLKIVVVSRQSGSNTVVHQMLCHQIRSEHGSVYWPVIRQARPDCSHVLLNQLHRPQKASQIAASRHRHTPALTTSHCKHTFIIRSSTTLATGDSVYNHTAETHQKPPASSKAPSKLKSTRSLPPVCAVSRVPPSVRHPV